jgi:hypothetical protein
MLILGGTKTSGCLITTRIEGRNDLEMAILPVSPFPYIFSIVSEIEHHRRMNAALPIMEYSSKVLISFTELRTKACLYNVNYLLFTMSGSEQSIM